MFWNSFCIHFNSGSFIFMHTCVTIETIEQQNPPKNAVANNISTDLANTVKIHDRENGNDIKVNSLRRPYCKKNPPKIPPNTAPAYITSTQRINWNKNYRFCAWFFFFFAFNGRSFQLFRNKKTEQS